MHTMAWMVSAKARCPESARGLDRQVEKWRSRPLAGRYPYLWLDAACLKVRVDGRVISQVVITAYAVRETGRREIIGVEAGYSEDAPFWTECLRGLSGEACPGFSW